MLWLGLFASVVLAGENSVQPAEAEAYILGVFPHLPPRELERVYAPIAADLGKAVGRPVLFRSSTSYERFMEVLDSQAFDIVFVQPFDYVHLADKYGYLPLATRNEPLETVFVVKQDSSIDSVADLKGKTIALPPDVAAVSHLAIGHLRQLGMQPGKDVTIAYFRSHVSCMQQVIIGTADACGTAGPALRFFQHKMGVKLKQIGVSRSIPHTLFAVNPRVPEADRQRLLKAIVSWADSKAGRAMLKRGKLSSFVPISDQAYDVVRNF